MIESFYKILNWPPLMVQVNLVNASSLYLMAFMSSYFFCCEKVTVIVEFATFLDSAKLLL